MGLKAALSKPFAAFVVRNIQKWKKNAVAAQQDTLQMLLNEAKNTAFGKDHGFSGIRSYEDLSLIHI